MKDYRKFHFLSYLFQDMYNIKHYLKKTYINPFVYVKDISFATRENTKKLTFL